MQLYNCCDYIERVSRNGSENGHDVLRVEIIIYMCRKTIIQFECSVHAGH